MRTILAAAAVALLAAPATATTLTFDTPDDCTTEAVTILAAGTDPCFVYAIPSGSANGTPLLQAAGVGTSFWTASFDRPASAVSVELGDNGSDADELFLSGFKGGTLVEQVLAVLPAGVTGLTTLSLVGAGFDAIRFGATDRLGTGGIQADNLSFAVAPIPLPATAWMMLAALGAAGLARRRG